MTAMTIRFTVVAALLAGCGLNDDGKTACQTQADCLDGYTCNTSTQTCETETGSGDDGPCVPLTCADVECGRTDDGCGSLVTCNACPNGMTCGQDNTCAPTPDHCLDNMKNMGESDVDCGGACNPCENGDSCAVQFDCATGTCQDDVCTAGRWGAAASMPTARVNVGAASVGGKVYVIGGYTSNNGVTGAVEVYDPTDDSWGTAASMLTPRYGFGTATSPDGVIYTIGSNYSSSPSSDGNSVIAESFNPSTNTWTSLPSLPDGRYMTAAVWSNGRIYVMGGITVNPIFLMSSVVSLAPGDSSWRTEPSMTVARDALGAAVDATGRIYVVGGLGTNSNKLATAEYFDPGTTSWHTLPDFSAPRHELSAVVVGQKLYAIGGNGADVYSQSVDVLDLTTKTWSLGTDEPNGRFGHALVVGPGNKIYSIGGSDAGPDNTSSTVDVFTP
ncbi:hypothetical protein BH11MYX2_BH11MYX2_24670 [soil metagenome]